MLFQNTATPENVEFLLLGLAAFVVIVPGWVATVVWRTRNLRRDKAMVEQILEEDKADR